MPNFLSLGLLLIVNGKGMVVSVNASRCLIKVFCYYQELFYSFQLMIVAFLEIWYNRPWYRGHRNRHCAQIKQGSFFIGNHREYGGWQQRNVFR